MQFYSPEKIQFLNKVHIALFACKVSHLLETNGYTRESSDHLLLYSEILSMLTNGGEENVFLQTRISTKTGIFGDDRSN